MFSERQKQIDKYMREIWNCKNRSVIYETFSEDAIIHSPMGEARGPKALDDAVRHWHVAFPDIRLTVLEIFENGDKVAVQWRAHGTHAGPFLGIPPSNLPIRCGGMTIYRIENDRIVEYWAYVNLQDVVHQISKQAEEAIAITPL